MLALSSHKEQHKEKYKFHKFDILLDDVLGQAKFITHFQGVKYVDDKLSLENLEKQRKRTDQNKVNANKKRKRTVEQEGQHYATL